MRMPRDVTGAEAVKALCRLGFEDVRQTGSHRILRNGSRTVVVPMHKPIKPGTLKGIVEQSGIDPAAFLAAL